MKTVPTFQEGVYRLVALCVFGATLLGSGLGSGVDAEERLIPEMSETVANDMNVGIEYTLTVDNIVVDSTEGKEAFHYVHGQRQMILGLERQLEGMHVGDTKDVTVNPSDGYGEIDPTAFVEVPKDQLPENVIPEVGMVLRGVNPDGNSFRAKISQVKDDRVVLDLNHPLAGKTLNFKLDFCKIASG